MEDLVGVPAFVRSGENSPRCNSAHLINELIFSSASTGVEGPTHLNTFSDPLREKILASSVVSSPDSFDLTEDSEGFWVEKAEELFGMTNDDLAPFGRLSRIPKSAKQTVLELIFHQMLSSSSLTPENLISTAEQLGPYIRELRLELNGCSFSDCQLEALRFFTELQVLTIATNSDLSEDPETIEWVFLEQKSAKIIAENLNSANLREVAFEGSPIDGPLMTELLKGLQDAKDLEILSFKHSSLHEDALSLLVFFLGGYCRNLRVLDLSDCELDDEAGFIVSEALFRHEMQISEINLSQNLFSSLSCAKILERISHNSSSPLKKIDFSSNMIEGAIVSQLAHLINSETRVEEIVLDGNEIKLSESSLKKLANAISANKSFKKLSMRFSGLSRDQKIEAENFFVEANEKKFVLI